MLFTGFHRDSTTTNRTARRLTTIDLNSAVVTAINDYLLVKSDNESSALFVSNNGNRLDGKDIARIVKKYAEPVGIVGVAYRR